MNDQLSSPAQMAYPDRYAWFGQRGRTVQYICAFVHTVLYCTLHTVLYFEMYEHYSTGQGSMALLKGLPSKRASGPV